jgi:AcrR family transcriptional regulator
MEADKKAEAGAGKKRSPEAIRLRKRSVLDAAADEFSEKGYSNADMDRIAESAKVGKGTIYRYFKSKEKLFDAVADDVIEQLRDFVIGAVRGEDIEGPIKQLNASGRAFLEFFEQRRAMLEIFLRGGSQFRERMQEKYLEVYRENIHIIQGLLDQCIELGLLKKVDSRMLADALGDMLIGLVYMWGARRDECSLADRWPLVEGILLEGILAS